MLDLSYDEYRYGVFASNSAAQLSILLYEGFTSNFLLMLLTLSGSVLVKKAIRESENPLDFK